MSGFYTAKELADLTGTSFDTVQRWRHRNEGPPFITLPSGNVRYPKQQADLWLESLAEKTGDDR